jgi:hypothetical protein
MKLNRYRHGQILDNGKIDSLRELYADCPNKEITFETFFKRHSRGDSIEELARPVNKKVSPKVNKLPKGKWSKNFFRNHPEVVSVPAEIYLARVTSNGKEAKADSVLYKIGVTTDWKRRKGELACVEFEVLRIGGCLGGLCEIEQAALAEFNSCKTSVLASTGIDGLKQEIFEMNDSELDELLTFIKTMRKTKSDGKGKGKRKAAR